MIINILGLLAAAVLLGTLVTLEFRRVGADSGQAVSPRVLGLSVGSRVVAVMWVVFLLLFVPRVLELLL